MAMGDPPPFHSGFTHHDLGPDGSKAIPIHPRWVEGVHPPRDASVPRAGGSLPIFRPPAPRADFGRRILALWGAWFAGVLIGTAFTALVLW